MCSERLSWVCFPTVSEQLWCDALHFMNEVVKDEDNRAFCTNWKHL